MYVSDFSTHKQELSQMLDSLKRTESIAHWNSASYDWMRDSLKNVIAGIKAMENKYTDADIPLQQEDAAKIEVLYRQMRLSAKEPAKPVPKKSGLAQTIRNAKRKASEAQEMRVGKLE